MAFKHGAAAALAAAVALTFAAALALLAACDPADKGGAENAGKGDGPTGPAYTQNEYDTRMLSLSAVTSSPNANMFIQNSPGGSSISLTVNGLSSYKGSSVMVDYQITDIFGETVKKDTLEYVKDKSASQSIPVDKTKLGHFTFTATIDGTPSIPARGSRPRNFIAYAVIINPGQRRQKAPYSDGGEGIDKYVYFGMAFLGGAIDGLTMTECLGIDVSYSGAMSWAHNTVGSGNNRRTNTASIESNNGYVLRQTIYNMIEMTAYFPDDFRTDAGKGGAYGGELNALGEQELGKYVQSLARVHIDKAGNRPRHYYQILWEPVDWWGAWRPMGDPGDAALVRMYQVAYEAIHAVYDEKALETGDDGWKAKAAVLGPTYSDAANRGQTLNWHKRMFDKGLAKYIDGLSIHPYNDPGTNGITDLTVDPGYADTVKALMDMTKEYYSARTEANPRYFDAPFFWATEQGVREEARSTGPAGQLKHLSRQNLIMMGEGFNANYAFCFADFSARERYGYFYNHTLGTEGENLYGPGRVSPKPVVSAYAAMSWLLKGYQSEGRVSGLSGTNFGYKYKDSESGAVVYALWNHEKNKAEAATINVNGPYKVYDIAGNETASGPAGNVSLTLSEFVQYVKVGG